MTGGQFFSIDYPTQGVRSTQAFGINPQGDVVGAYMDAAGVTHGFLLTHTRHHAE
jgi:probable HAF family extracellular repeat protein